MHPSVSVNTKSSPLKAAAQILAQAGHVHPVAHVSHLSPLGIVNSKTALEDVQVFTTQAQVPADPVVVDQTLTVAQGQVGH